MAYYCVLWIPTVFHKKLYQLSTHCEREVDISDLQHCPHRVKVRLDESGSVSITTLEKEEVITLRLIDTCSNGLFLYEYSINDEENSLIGKEIPYAIYHIVKEFYHTHEHHAPEEDAYLKPYCSEIKPEIKNNDNEALMHYLKNYHDKFSAYLNQIHYAYNALKERKKSPQATFLVSTKANKQIIGLCMKARGEELYYNALNKSKHNTLCKSDNKRNPELSKLAFNIENTLESIRLIESKVLHEYSFLTTKLSINIAWVAFFVGLVLGVISLLQ